MHNRIGEAFEQHKENDNDRRADEGHAENNCKMHRNDSGIRKEKDSAEVLLRAVVPFPVVYKRE